MQLLVKFKQILRMGFRATLNFQKFKVALNPMAIYRNFLNFAKSCVLSCLSNVRQCYTKQFSLQLATQQTLRCKLQEKIHV